MANKESVVLSQDISDGDDVGARLKAVRIMHDLSQRELAKRAGVTNATISLIEQGRVSPSVGSLKKVLDGIPLSLAEFFSLRFDDQSPVFFHADDMPVVGEGAIRSRLLGAAGDERDMSILHTVYPPGTDSGPQLYCRGGAQGGIIMAGQLEVMVGGEVALLGPGDGYYFSNNRPHRFRNPGDCDCVLVSAISAPFN
ncbi:transcriptional regulator, XRE family with cupin sensor [Microbulbifer donghaiensis]|uniref:Transcriptional regulator, XRE family with cupin sensor n=1 Tax=Microbulbifer donghaiensis TaxID=494016 RepID=A0A1M5GPI4_9GAMM|nr:cupin domain-containing protein [Microbulbifer donghaiensis]SHG05606.1 transcriptional regulator, XRE family with cupin sensor [Microbulbifer donghaiensis]